MRGWLALCFGASQSIRLSSLALKLRMAESQGVDVDLSLKTHQKLNFFLPNLQLQTFRTLLSSWTDFCSCNLKGR